MAKAAVILFPGSNRERDMIACLHKISGQAPQTVWYTETSLPNTLDLIVIPGGFSYGDYLRSGAIAARAPVMKAVHEAAKRGVKILGVCNGFQILTESHLLPGALMRNRDLKFISRELHLQVTNTQTAFTSQYQQGQIIRCPVAHHDGNYFAEENVLKSLQDQDRITFKYCDQNGSVDEINNPNGSSLNIAGILNKEGNVMGMMPHPENLIEPAHQGTDGRHLFESLLAA